MNNWTTEKPTEAGWYFAYGILWRFTWKPQEKQNPDRVTLVQLTRSLRKEKNGDKDLYIFEGFIGMQQTVSDCGFTHWMKVEMPNCP